MWRIWSNLIIRYSNIVMYCSRHNIFSKYFKISVGSKLETSIFYKILYDILNE